MSAVTSPVHVELAALQVAFPGAALAELGDGSFLITLPNVPLPGGWNQTHTTVCFIAPVNYPLANPDCFWTDANLRLSHGAMPGNASPTPLPGLAGTPTETRLWFSWHVGGWTPGRDNLLTYARVVENRFKERR